MAHTGRLHQTWVDYISIMVFIVSNLRSCDSGLLVRNFPFYGIAGIHITVGRYEETIMIHDGRKLSLALCPSLPCIYKK